jgi:hypothetical protein
MTFPEVLAVVKDIVLMGTAVAAMYVAFKGLGTWNRQLKGGAEYELTRRLLRSTYRMRETMKAVRNPVVFQHEQPAPPEEPGTRMS